jgi:hypothetical protein
VRWNSGTFPDDYRVVQLALGVTDSS